jgi:hypothetical protein
MKNQRVYSGPLDIHSINASGDDLPGFDGKEPAIEVTYDFIGSLTGPVHRTTILYLKDIWLIGKQNSPASEGESQHLYVDDSGVNHENARKSLASDKVKKCRRCGSHNVPAARVASLCDHCLTMVTR